jgi:hypothetical protein
MQQIGIALTLKRKSSMLHSTILRGLLTQDHRYMIEKLPEGGTGIHGTDDGEGDD